MFAEFYLNNIVYRKNDPLIDSLKQIKTQKMEAYNSGYEACKKGTNINNCYPYTKGNGYWDWLDGWRDCNEGKPNKYQSNGTR